MRLLLSYAAGFDLGGAWATLREPTTPQDVDVRDTLNTSIPLLKLKFWG
ncbi:hypothetical protein L5470_07000 [Synechococcus sp. PCC 6717]|nr:hypothetical protein [Thermostichus lividus]MCI3280725.1 hypothetical protein [Synechococcus sp. PCC 6717]